MAQWALAMAPQCSFRVPQCHEELAGVGLPAQRQTVLVELLVALEGRAREYLGNVANVEE